MPVYNWLGSSVRQGKRILRILHKYIKTYILPLLVCVFLNASGVSFFSLEYIQIWQAIAVIAGCYAHLISSLVSSTSCVFEFVSCLLPLMYLGHWWSRRHSRMSLSRCFYWYHHWRLWHGEHQMKSHDSIPWPLAIACWHLFHPLALTVAVHSKNWQKYRQMLD